MRALRQLRTELFTLTLISFLQLAALIAVIYYLWFITCTALQLVWYVGVAMVAIEFVASRRCEKLVAVADSILVFAKLP